MKNIVFIGGGGGVTNIAPGLRDQFHVTAIVTTFDDGGSTGRLKASYKTPAVGDLRRAFAALSTNSLGHQTEYRYEEGELKGHTSGNLLLTSVFLQNESTQGAMDILHDLFAVKGKVIGVSYDQAELQAQLKDRSIIRGEHTIDEPHEKSHIRIDRLWLDPEPQPAEGILKAIEQADLIIMGPGDLYTSLLPCLIVEGVSQAIKATRAKKVYFCNKFTVFGQTHGFDASDHIRIIEKQLETKIDTVIYNTSKVNNEVIEYHRAKKEELVDINIDEMKEAGYDVLSRDLLDRKVYSPSGADALKRSRIRYAPENVFATVSELLENQPERE